MKKIILTLAIGISSISMSFANKPVSLKNEIKEKISVELNDNKIENSELGYIELNFKIVDGKIVINKINGSTSYSLKKYIFSKLSQIEIDSSYEVNKNYNYKLTFKN